MTETVLHPIAHMESDFGTKFGIPRIRAYVAPLSERRKDLNAFDAMSAYLRQILLNDQLSRFFRIAHIKHLEVLSVLEVGVIVVDGLGVYGNPAVMCLSKHRIQYCRRNKFAPHQLAEHISCPD